ncbi:Tol-Pal system beta propeller repeat protein TolB [Gammaproteobacteria bacterium AB-CW1]|uniref:Tol-Pal system protein TolB n=1 Tax=Natronospira elongata TaxID=3110268 RepID=A0AAP6MJJ6_9GAMM|nr:Tol-Pal system beta propeller repeat protein TolB [Gammaproteobacteria bacterium AB-CW1]
MKQANHYRRAGWLILLLWLFAPAVWADEVLRVDITSGVDAAEPVAVVPFAWEADGEAGQDVAAIIAANLERSGRFRPLSRDELPARPGIEGRPSFSEWREAEADNLIVGEVRQSGDRLDIRFRVYDVHRGEQVLGYSLPARADRLRRAAHQISDMIYERLTGDPGAFNTRLAYVQVERRNGRERFHLVVADSDGENPRQIMSSSHPIMSPAWSPDGERLAYVSFENRRSEIFVQELRTGQRQSVSARDGINGAPAFSPDGKRLAMTLSVGDGGPDIHVLDLESGEFTRVTRSRAIDTEPAWFPDGDRLAFTSDRGGAPQIYSVGVDGGQLRRLTFDGNYNARPMVSPDGRRLAMIHRGAQPGFRIAVQDMERRGLTVLGEGNSDESPSFAPNGAMIIYASRSNGQGVLSAVSTDGRVRQRLGSGESNVREPAWSPRLDAVDRGALRGN